MQREELQDVNESIREARGLWFNRRRELTDERLKWFSGNDFHKLALFVGKLREYLDACQGIVDTVCKFEDDEAAGRDALSEYDPILDFVTLDYKKATETLAQLLGMVVHTANTANKTIDEVEGRT